MPWISPAEYAHAMRRLEEMRNEANALKDRHALLEIRLRETDLNSAFWRRQGGSAPRRGGR